MISANQLSMRYGGKILFKDSSFQLNPGNHYGLVGANGSGKSTLIKILTKEITPESGEIATPSQAKIGTLKQNQFLFDNIRIIDTVIMGREPLWRALEKKRSLLLLDNFSENHCLELDEIEKVIQAQEGYTAESEAAKILEGLGLSNKIHEQPMKILSGGYKLRVLLAQVLFSHPDILLLDEPTNHLDIFSIKWLEEYLKDFPGTLLISSHDRDFLNGICSYTIDVDYGKIRIYRGNYNEFVETKALHRQLTQAILDKQEKKRDDIQSFIDRFKAKASKARQAQSKMKFVEKLDEQIDSLDLSESSRQYPNLKFDICRPSGAIALKVKGVHKSYGTKSVLKEVSFDVNRGDRIAILGPNGIGKSTLLEIITSHTEADQGSIEWGFASQYAYFAQEHKREIIGNPSLLDWLGQFDRQVSEEQLRGILAKVLFSGDDVKKCVDILSGGETARLILAKMMLAKHNILIFDEPTNHLDMEATEALLDALKNYQGTLIFVSHNRYFISHIADRIVEITQEGINDFRCGYSEYLLKREIDFLSVNQKTAKHEKEPDFDRKSKFREQKNFRNSKALMEKKVLAVEKKCHDLEKKIRSVNELLSSENFYQKTPQEKQFEILSEKDCLERSLESAMVEWEEVSNLLLETVLKP